MFQVLRDCQNILTGQFIGELSVDNSTQTRAERKRKAKMKRKKELIQSIKSMADTHIDYHTRNWW